MCVVSWVRSCSVRTYRRTNHCQRLHAYARPSSNSSSLTRAAPFAPSLLAARRRRGTVFARRFNYTLFLQRTCSHAHAVRTPWAAAMPCAPYHRHSSFPPTYRRAIPRGRATAGRRLRPFSAAPTSPGTFSRCGHRPLPCLRLQTIPTCRRFARRGVWFFSPLQRLRHGPSLPLTPSSPPIQHAALQRCATWDLLPHPLPCISIRVYTVTYLRCFTWTRTCSRTLPTCYHVALCLLQATAQRRISTVTLILPSADNLNAMHICSIPTSFLPVLVRGLSLWYIGLWFAYADAQYYVA